MIVRGQWEDSFGYIGPPIICNILVKKLFDIEIGNTTTTTTTTTTTPCCFHPSSFHVVYRLLSWEVTRS